MYLERQQGRSRGDQNLGRYRWGLGDDPNASAPWQEVTYLPTQGVAGQDTYTSPPTYFDPSNNTDWLAGIGFDPKAWGVRTQVTVPEVFYGGGETGGYGPGPLPDGYVWHEGGYGVSGGEPAYVEDTPVRRFERARGLRQQVVWMPPNYRYARYVDSSGNQVGPVVRTYKEGKFATILGRVVQVVAGTMVAVGGAQAIAAVAAGVTGGAGAAGAAGAAPAAAVPEAAAALPAAAAPSAAESIVAAAAAPSAITPIASAVAPSVAAGGAVTSALTTAASVVPTVLKAIPVVAGVVKAVQGSPQQNPIAPPASMVPAPITPSSLAPTVYDPTIFNPQRQTPSWLIPAAIGGGVLLLAMLGKQRRNQPRRTQRRTTRR